MLCPPGSNEDDIFRQILVMLASDDRATRLKGARKLFRRSVQPLFVFAKGKARSSRTDSLRALWELDSDVLDVLAVGHVVMTMRERLKSKARRGAFPKIRNLSNYVTGIFKRVAYDIWRQQRREELRYRNGYNGWDSITDYRCADPLDEIERNEMKEVLREDIRDFVSRLNFVDRTILETRLDLDKGSFEKQGRNKRLFASANDAIFKRESRSMSQGSIVQRCNRLLRELKQHLRERDWHVQDRTK